MGHGIMAHIPWPLIQIETLELRYPASQFK